MHRDRERARRAIVGLLVAAVAVACGSAQAADIRVRASHDCADRAEIAEQVDALLGRPVAAVEGLDFDVDIAEGAQRRWRLRLTTIGRADGAKRSREIDGSGCAQLADAAAVAITMSIQSSGAAEPKALDAPPVATDEPTNVVAEPTPVAPPPRTQFPIAVAALADTGALPHIGWGVGLGAGVARGPLLVVAEGAFLFSPEARTTDSSGGRFRLIVGALLACLQHRFGPGAIQGCAGAEAGVVQAEGIGINRPRSRNVAWGAGRLELGFARPLNDTASLFIRVGAAVPWSRPTFTLNNETQAVHRSDVVSGRLTAGATFDFF